MKINHVTLKPIFICVTVNLTMKIILSTATIRKVLNMTFAFAGGTVIVYAFVMRHVLRNVTH